MLKTISRFSIIGIFLLLGFSFLFSPLNTSAELNNVLLEDYGNLLTSVDENGDVIEIESLINEGNSSKALGIYIQFIIKLAFGFGSIAAVVLIIYGGIEYIISGTFSKKEGGKKKITHSLGAIALLAISFFFFDIVNPDVLNVRFKPLGGDVVVEGAAYREMIKSEDYKEAKECAVNGNIMSPNGNYENAESQGISNFCGGYTEYNNPDNIMKSMDQCKIVLKEKKDDGFQIYQNICIKKITANPIKYIFFYKEPNIDSLKISNLFNDEISCKIKLEQLKEEASVKKDENCIKENNKWHFKYK